MVAVEQRNNGGRGPAAEEKTPPNTPPTGRSMGQGRQSPLSQLLRNLLLALLALGTAATVVAGNTSASFTATSTNPTQSFAAGTLLMTNVGASDTACATSTSSNTGCGTLRLSSNANLVPGDLSTGTVTITNSGTLPATMTLSFANVSAGFGTLLNAKLHDDTTNTCIFGEVAGVKITSNPTKGNTSATATPTPFVTDRCDNLSSSSLNANTTFSSLSTANITVPGNGTDGKWASGESHDFDFTIGLPSSASPSATDSASIDFLWTATQ